MGFMMNYAYRKQYFKVVYGMATSIVLNLIFLFAGILADPGVPRSVYVRYAMDKYGDSSKTIEKETELTDRVSQSDKEEKGLVNRSRGVDQSRRSTLDTEDEEG